MNQVSQNPLAPDIPKNEDNTIDISTIIAEPSLLVPIINPQAEIYEENEQNNDPVELNDTQNILNNQGKAQEPLSVPVSSPILSLAPT